MSGRIWLKSTFAAEQKQRIKLFVFFMGGDVRSMPLECEALEIIADLNKLNRVYDDLEFCDNADSKSG